MKKILYVASTASHIRSFHLPIIERLRSDGYEVMTLADGEGVDYSLPLVKRFFSRENAVFRKRFARIVQGGDFHAVILNTTLAAFHARLAMKKRRPRTVNFVHGYLFSGNTPTLKERLLLLCERLMRSRTDAIVVMNEEDLAIAKDNRLSRGEVYFTRGCGVTRRERCEEREHLRARLIDTDAFVLAFVGELSARKNQAFLIEALPRLKKEIPNVRLWLLGEGAERERLEALARTLGVSDLVRFLGFVRNPNDYMNASDLYVSASRGEGLPFNAVEALGEGADVLLSDIKGHRDIVNAFGAGDLFDLQSMDDFVNKTLLYYKRKTTVDPEIKQKTFAYYEKETVLQNTYSAIRKALESPRA